MGRASSLDEVSVSSYSYNSLGQRTSKESSASNVQESYSWNKLEQLTGTESSEMEIQYEYRADGLLTGKSTNESEQSLLWGRMYDLPVILSDDQYDYVYGEEISPFAQIDKTTGEIEYLHHDQVGSVIAKTNETGNLVNSTSFSSYGEGTPVSAFGYAGGWTDEDAGLIYYRARWYDPEVGKFISIDPLLEITQDPYGYAGNSPFSYIDPHGLFLDKIGNGLESLGKGAASLGKTVVKGVTTAKDVVIDYVENTPIADMLSHAATITGTVALAMVLVTPVGLPITALGMTSLGLGLLSSGAYAIKGDYGNAVINGLSAVPGIGSVAILSKMNKITRATGLSKRNPYSGLRGYNNRLNVSSQFLSTPLPVYTDAVSPFIHCIAMITERATR